MLIPLASLCCGRGLDRFAGQVIDFSAKLSYGFFQKLEMKPVRTDFWACV